MPDCIRITSRLWLRLQWLLVKVWAKCWMRWWGSIFKKPRCSPESDVGRQREHVDSKCSLKVLLDFKYLQMILTFNSFISVTEYFCMNVINVIINMLVMHRFLIGCLFMREVFKLVYLYDICSCSFTSPPAIKTRILSCFYWPSLQDTPPSLPVIFPTCSLLSTMEACLSNSIFFFLRF